LVELLLSLVFITRENCPRASTTCFGPRWKPVNTNEEQEDEERHPNILKKDLNETALSEEGVKVDVNNMTTVTWTTDEKEDLKKEEVKEEVKEVKEDEKVVKDTEETEKKEEEKPAEPASEEEPLKKED